MRKLRKIQKLFFLVVGDRNRAEVGRFLIRHERRIEFFSRVDQGEKREKFFSLCPQTFGR